MLFLKNYKKAYKADFILEIKSIWWLNMSKRAGGFRRKTRNKLKKADKGRISIRKFIQKFEDGQKVLLNADSSVQKGMYFPRYHSKIGIIKGKKGKCYEVGIKDGNKSKILIVHPVHLRRLKQ